MSGEGEMRLQPQKLSRQVTLVRADQLGHGDFAVVVAEARRHAAEKGEGPGMALVERLGTFPRKETAKTRIAVRERQHEQGRLVTHAGNDALGAAKVHLALAGRMEQGHEDLGLGLLVDADGVADDAGAAGVTVLVTQALIDTSGGVTLLGWCVAIRINDLLEDGQEGAKDRLGAGRRDTEGRRLGLPDDLADGPEVEVVF